MKLNHKSNNNLAKPRNPPAHVRHCRHRPDFRHYAIFDIRHWHRKPKISIGFSIDFYGESEKFINAENFSSNVTCKLWNLFGEPKFWPNFHIRACVFYLLTIRLLRSAYKMSYLFVFVYDALRQTIFCRFLWPIGKVYQL